MSTLQEQLSHPDEEYDSSDALSNENIHVVDDDGDDEDYEPKGFNISTDSAQPVNAKVMTRTKFKATIVQSSAGQSNQPASVSRSSGITTITTTTTSTYVKQICYGHFYPTR